MRNEFDSYANWRSVRLVNRSRLLFHTYRVVGLLLATTPAYAELSWQAPDECSRRTFTKELERATEHPLNALPVAIELEIEREDAAQWVARFHLVDDMGDVSAERELRGSSCDDVGKAAAVAVAMALHDENDPTLSNEPAPAPGGSEPQNETASKITAPSPEGPNVAPDLGLHALLLVDTSLFGDAALGGGMGVSVYGGSFGFEVEGSALLPKALSVNQTLGVELVGGLASAIGCYRAVHVTTEPRLCLGYQGAYVNAQGTGPGLKASREQSALWHAAHARGSMGTALSESFTLRLFIAASVALSRARFVFDTNRTAHELPAWSAQAGLQLEWTW